jgi:hypothetical protein
MLEYVMTASTIAPALLSGSNTTTLGRQASPALIKVKRPRNYPNV